MLPSWGSLVPVGGHNLLEPAALAKPTLIGPHFFNFSDITRQLVDKKACQVIHDESELATHVLQLFSSPEQRHTMGMAAFDGCCQSGHFRKEFNGH